MRVVLVVNFKLPWRFSYEYSTMLNDNKRLSSEKEKQLKKNIYKFSSTNFPPQALFPQEFSL